MRIGGIDRRQGLRPDRAVHSDPIPDHLERPLEDLRARPLAGVDAGVQILLGHLVVEDLWALQGQPPVLIIDSLRILDGQVLDVKTRIRPL